MFKKMSEYVILFPDFQEENTDFVGSLKNQLGIPYAEQKKKETFNILYRSILRQRKLLGIPYCGTKIEINFQYFVLN
jgi:hypothetical protein